MKRIHVFNVLIGNKNILVIKCIAEHTILIER